MTKLVNETPEVRLESYYTWHCPKCKERIGGFDSDLVVNQFLPNGLNIYRFFCPNCRKYLPIISSELFLDTQGEGVVE